MRMVPSIEKRYNFYRNGLRVIQVRRKDHENVRQEGWDIVGVGLHESAEP
jgi:hypothetical protein